MANTIELKRILKSPVREIRMRGSVRVASCKVHKELAA